MTAILTRTASSRADATTETQTRLSSRKAFTTEAQPTTTVRLGSSLWQRTLTPTFTQESMSSSRSHSMKPSGTRSHQLRAASLPALNAATHASHVARMTQTIVSPAQKASRASSSCRQMYSLARRLASHSATWASPGTEPLPKLASPAIPHAQPADRVERTKTLGCALPAPSAIPTPGSTRPSALLRGLAARVAHSSTLRRGVGPALRTASSAPQPLTASDVTLSRQHLFCRTKDA